MPEVTQATLFSLPKELIDIIFSHLSMNDFYSLMRVSRGSNAFVHDPFFWQKLFVKRVRVDHFDAMIAQLSKWRHLRILHLNYFEWVISGPMIGQVVDACPQLVELKVTACVTRWENDMMTSLSRLTNLKKLFVESNSVAFAPSFTIPALKCWSGLRVLEFKEMWHNPPTNRPYDGPYEIIDLDGMVKQIGLSHGSTLRTLKIDFPFLSGRVNLLSSVSLKFISEHCPNLESLGLQRVTSTDQHSPIQLSLLESFTIKFNSYNPEIHSLSALESMLGIADGNTELALPKLKECLVVLGCFGMSHKGKAAFGRMKKRANFRLSMTRCSCHNNNRAEVPW